MFLDTIMILECIIVGLTTFLVGHIGFKLTTNHENKDEKSQPQGIGLAFFVSGVVLHLVLEFIGFNKFYCNRRCRATLDILQ